MDWPTRSISSRIKWLLGAARTHRPRRARACSLSPRPPGTRHTAETIEHLYSLQRPEGRPPLLVLTATDTEGHLTSAVTCDSEGYE